MGQLLRVRNGHHLTDVSFLGDIEKLLAYLVKGGMDIKDLAIHCHDTYGQALANILMSLQVREFI